LCSSILVKSSAMRVGEQAAGGFRGTPDLEAAARVGRDRPATTASLSARWTDWAQSRASGFLAASASCRPRRMLGIVNSCSRLEVSVRTFKSARWLAVYGLLLAPVPLYAAGVDEAAAAATTTQGLDVNLGASGVDIALK
jgi:hypothetical protein